MLNNGSRITLLRKDKGWSQGDLSKELGEYREIIGKYERNENLPSIEMALKMSNAFGVTMNYLLGEGEFVSFDKDLMDRIKDFENIDKNTKAKIFDVMDTYIRDVKARAAYAK